MNVEVCKLDDIERISREYLLLYASTVDLSEKVKCKMLYEFLSGFGYPALDVYVLICEYLLEQWQNNPFSSEEDLCLKQKGLIQEFPTFIHLIEYILSFTSMRE